MLNLLEIYKREIGFTKKKFGQHFLTSKQFIDMIADSLVSAKCGQVVEIGPGCGVLTHAMLEKGAKVTAVEIDEELADFLPRYLFIYKGFKIIHSDFMKITENDLPEGKIAFAGNLPYNVSVDILMHCTNFFHKIEKMTFMFQKEVADRINAKPNCKEYTSLSVITDYFFTKKKLRDISGGQFWPNTKVRSTVLEFYPKERHFEAEKEKLFLTMVKSSFMLKRKTLHNNLKAYETHEAAMERAGLASNIRGEQMELSDFIRLFEEMNV
ncbi:MAG: ribosomal RNA small subunit methyltransferase A [Denitrovibrio sp.]|nr:MAG: ribosomal RNA small subunit methyltransferase A [Denitrovibrio sp.]